ncbi:MAG: adenylyltransferase/cytidyltransferase family protein [Sphingomonadales bacterium]|nr:adenylyltransferase/cytidyltransferase family protein [Sphingomonadales bacterium]
MGALDLLQSKVTDRAEFVRRIHLWKAEGKLVVFTNGCFDLVHRGHVEYLSRAADLGDVLVVALNTDRSVTGLKGPSRPLQNEDARALVMASLGVVALVTLFDEDTPESLISEALPQVLVKGTDYSPGEIAGASAVQAAGGRVMTIPLTPGFSTSSIIDRMG